MADLKTTESTYGTSGIDTHTDLVNNVDSNDADHINHPVSAILNIETTLGAGETLKGTQANLVTRLAQSIEPTGKLKDWTATSKTTFPPNASEVLQTTAGTDAAILEASGKLTTTSTAIARRGGLLVHDGTSRYVPSAGPSRSVIGINANYTVPAGIHLLRVTIVGACGLGGNGGNGGSHGAGCHAHSSSCVGADPLIGFGGIGASGGDGGPSGRPIIAWTTEFSVTPGQVYNVSAGGVGTTTSFSGNGIGLSVTSSGNGGNGANGGSGANASCLGYPNCIESNGAHGSPGANGGAGADATATFTGLNGSSMFLTANPGGAGGKAPGGSGTPGIGATAGNVIVDALA